MEGRKERGKGGGCEVRGREGHIWMRGLRCVSHLQAGVPSPSSAPKVPDRAGWDRHMLFMGEVACFLLRSNFEGLEKWYFEVLEVDYFEVIEV